MDLLTARHIKKNYSEKQLLEDVDLIIHEGDKIGLVGVNGSGKSTLLKIIAGVMEAEGGEIVRANGLRTGYLPQDPEYEPELTVSEQLQLSTGGSVEDYVWRSMLSKLGLSDTDLKMKQLSGGQRKKVALTAVLCRENDLLILDEPTNHMDTDIVEWLEDRLAEFKGAVLMITHDRYFLERVTDHICEIEKGRLISYEGNYDQYLQAKAARLSMAMATERKRAAIYKKELRWIHWSAPARTTKSRGRIQRFEELEKGKQTFEDPRMEIAAVSTRLGKKIIEVEHLSKRYGEKNLIDDFTYTILRNDRIGILGPNGCGKTTLLRMLAGQLMPDSGTVATGETVRIGYFSQEAEELDPNKRVIKFIEDIALSVKTDDGYLSASQMLERFLFPSYMHSTMIGRLSGGEKRRLALLAILMRAPNVLIFDEPTNDLDIDTLTILEDYLDDFPGAVIIASHDRYFLDRIVNRIFAFESGTIVQYEGGYTDYYLSPRRPVPESVKARDTAKNESPKPAKTHEKKLKFTFQEQRDFDRIDDVIAALEERIAAIEEEMNANASDFVLLRTLTEEKEQLEAELEEKMDRWVYLNDLAERIEAERQS
ncbi:MAG: ABC-F family ATP-binding cassette domain-containing protein, partial [Firmicutes bacterium]|nr:ABC-F family ATP-binding cassette domain-containing protein [Bacillota bacterium]